MATKAELEKELLSLKLELENSRLAYDAKKRNMDKTDAELMGKTEHDTEGLSQILVNHGLDLDQIEDLGATLIDELKMLHKEKPVTVLIATFILGLFVGRVSK